MRIFRPNGKGEVARLRRRLSTEQADIATLAAFRKEWRQEIARKHLGCPSTSYSIGPSAGQAPLEASINGSLSVRPIRPGRAPKFIKDRPLAATTLLPIQRQMVGGPN